MPCNTVTAVTATEVHIISINSGRSDYVIQGESAQLSCHYKRITPEEKIASVRWEKDGHDVRHTITHIVHTTHALPDY